MIKDILVIENISKTFGGVIALDDINFTVEEGTIVGIIGPNGAGKSTLFNVITGFLKPNKGTIKFYGENIEKLKPHQIAKKGVARTFQISKVFNDFTVYEHVLSGVIVKDLRLSPTIEQVEEAERIIDLVGLTKYKNFISKNLTSELQRRLLLATGLATKPKLILLDELMAGLTYVEIDNMIKLLQYINEKMKITLIIVEHVMKAVMSLCSKIIVINYGKKIAEGSPKEIANNKAVIEAYLGEEFMNVKS